MLYAREADAGLKRALLVKSIGRRCLAGLCAALALWTVSAFSSSPPDQDVYWGRKAVPGINATGQSTYVGLNYTKHTASVEITAFCDAPTNPAGKDTFSYTDTSLFAISNSCSAVTANGIVHMFYKGFATNAKHNVQSPYYGSLKHAMLKYTDAQYSISADTKPIWTISSATQPPQSPPTNTYDWQLSVAAAYSSMAGTAFIFEPWYLNRDTPSQVSYMGVTSLTFNSDGSIASQSTFSADANTSFCKSPHGFYSVVDAQAFYDINGNEKILLIYVEMPSSIPNGYLWGGTAYSIVFDPMNMQFDLSTIAQLPPYTTKFIGTDGIYYTPVFPVYGSIVQSTIGGSFYNYYASNLHQSTMNVSWQSGKENVVEFPSVWSQEYPFNNNISWEFILCEYNTQSGKWTSVNPADPSDCDPTGANLYLEPSWNFQYNYPFQDKDYSFAVGVNTYTEPNTFLNTQAPKNSYMNIVNSIQVTSKSIGESGVEYANLTGDTYAPIFTMAGLATNSSIVESNPQSTPSYLQNLWIYQGMVLGLPPYWPNGFVEGKSYDDNAWDSLASVTVGTESDSSSSQQSTSQTTYSAGASEDISFLAFSEKLSYNYSHTAVQSYSTQTTNKVVVSNSLSTASQYPPSQFSDIQQLGMVFYLAPKFNMQMQQGFAYDYTPSTNSGTPTNLYMYGQIPTSAPFSDHPTFTLTQPGTGDSCFFLSTMEGFPASTDIAGWVYPNNYDWSNPPDNEWSQIVPDVTLLETVGDNQKVFYSSSQQVQSTNSKTHSNSVGSETGIKIPIGLFSFTTTLSGSWENSVQTATTNTFTCGQDAGCAGFIPKTENPTDYAEIDVQPYLMQAQTADVPWLPLNYTNALPWCMSWNVLYWLQNNGNSGGASGECASASGTLQATAVTTGEAAATAASTVPTAGKDSYTVKKGKLVYLDNKGNERGIDMSADDFEATLGAHFRINDLIFSAGASDGAWKRSKNVWKFNSKVDTYKLSLTLDFDKAEWSVTLSKTDIASHVKPISRSLRLELKLNGSKGSRTLVRVIKHDNDFTWSKAFTTDPSTYCMSSISASYNEINGKGTVKIEGTLPEQLGHFGDMDIALNGSKVHFNVNSDVKDFPHLFQSGKLKSFNLTDKTTKAKLSVNLTKKTWTATIPSNLFAFPRPKGRDSNVTATVSVGGREVLSETFNADKYSVKMSHTTK